MAFAQQSERKRGLPVDAWETEEAEFAKTSPHLGAGAEDHASTMHMRSERGGPTAKSEHIPKWRRPSVYWLIAPFLLYTLAFGGIMVPKVNLHVKVVDLICRSYVADQVLADPKFTSSPVVVGGDNPQCFVPEVQQKVMTLTLVMSMLTGILSAFTVQKLGSLSDRHGRTRLLVFATMGGVGDEIIAILAAKFPDTVHFRWLILGAVLDGLTGSFTASSVLTNSYASDCTPPSKRGVHIGYLHASMFMGMAFGPLVAGYIVKLTGSLLSIFYFSLGCHIFYILFIWFVTPESLSNTHRMLAWQRYDASQNSINGTNRAKIQASLQKEAPAGSFNFLKVHFWKTLRLLGTSIFRPLKILASTGPFKGQVRRNIIIFALIDVIIMSIAMGSGMVTILYVETAFQWGTFESSRFVSLMSLVRAMALLIVLPAINYIFRRHPLQHRHRRESGASQAESNTGADEVDLWLLRAALLLEILGAIGYVFSRRSDLFVLSGVIASFGGMGGAVLQGALTKHVPAEQVGSLLGALGLLQSLGRVFAPMLFNGVYAATVHVYSQAFFLLLCMLLGSGFLGSMFLKPHLFLEDGEYESVPQADFEDRTSGEFSSHTELSLLSGK